MWALQAERACIRKVSGRSDWGEASPRREPPGHPVPGGSGPPLQTGVHAPLPVARRLPRCPLGSRPLWVLFPRQRNGTVDSPWPRPRCRDLPASITPLVAAGSPQSKACVQPHPREGSGAGAREGAAVRALSRRAPGDLPEQLQTAGEAGLTEKEDGLLLGTRLSITDVSQLSGKQSLIIASQGHQFQSFPSAP